jgi:predicted nucleic acid-binding protein
MELTQINGSEIYFDTNIFIYALEDSKEYREQITALFSRIQQTGSLVVTSELTLAECLVKPFEKEDELSSQHYESYIKTSEFLEVKAVTRTILKEAARNKAIYRNKLPDSIHLATALHSGCAIFATNDATIKTPDNIILLVIKDLTINY